MSGKNVKQLLDEHAAIREQQIAANQKNLLVAKEYARIMGIPSGKAGGGKKAKATISEEKASAQLELHKVNKLLTNIEKEIQLFRAAGDNAPLAKDQETARFARDHEGAEAAHLANTQKDVNDARAKAQRDREDAEVARLARERTIADNARAKGREEAEVARLARERKIADDARTKDQEEAEVARLAREQKDADDACAKAQRDREDAEVARLARERTIADNARTKDREEAEEARLARERTIADNARAKDREEAEVARLARERKIADDARTKDQEEAEVARLAREQKDADDARAKAQRDREDAEVARLARERTIADNARTKDREEAEVARLAREQRDTNNQEAYLAHQRKMHKAQKSDAAAIAMFLTQNYNDDQVEQANRNIEEAAEGARLVKEMRLLQENLRKSTTLQQQKRQLDESEGDEVEEERRNKSSKKKQKPAVENLRRESDDEDLAISTADSDVETTFLKKRKVEKKRKNEGQKTMNKKETPFKSLTDKQMDNLRKDGEIAITNFLRNPTKFSLDPALRKMIRENQTFLPRAATTSRLLALEVLETNRYNIFCLYHHTKDKAGKVQDGEGRFLINGVPHERQVSHSTTKALRVTPPKGYMNCGCDEEMALLDFFMWKTWSVTAEIDNELITEGLKEKVWSPRERTFIIEQYRNLTGLTVDDLYAADQSNPKVIITRLKKQIRFQLDQLNAIEATEGAEEERVIHPVLFPVFPKITKDGRDLMDFSS